MNLLEKKTRGQQAETLLSDPLLAEALREVKFACHRAFERAYGDPVKLQRASDMLAAANDFHLYLRKALDAGKAAAKEIDRDLQGGRFVRGIGRMVRSREDEDEALPWSA